MTDPIYLCLNTTGRATAQGLSKALGGEVVSPESMGDALQEHFTAGRPIVAFCAAGIVIRALAPLLKDKHSEPPVLAVAADGSSIVPLLGGHHGANALSLEIGRLLNVAPALTTAGEVLSGVALDAPPSGWGMSNVEAARPLMAALAEGQPVRLDHDAGPVDWLGAGFADQANLTLRVTDKVVTDGFALHPPVLALGVGCERDTDPAEVQALAEKALSEAGLSAKSLACVCSIDVKSDEAAVLQLAEAFNVPARFFTAADLEAEAERLANPSDVVFAEVGCHGVCEGAALAAGGIDAELIVPKVKSKRATCAIARSAHAIDPMAVGKARGRLFVVGIGPGAEDWRTPEVSKAVAQSDVLVGYGLYLDLLGDAATGKSREQSELGKEEDRVRRALELAAEGETVSLVCSGDAGIYALATLVFEMLERGDDPAWSRVLVQVCPGISALQAAAARAGAPLGHDFCTISLSDLLTPRHVIEQRLEAAAKGDFVMSFYNPVSKRRRELLDVAKGILLKYRPEDTPVILARNLGRVEENVTVITLKDLEVHMVDMLTLVMVGNSETRRTGPWVYTPRGYAGKHKETTP